MGFFDKLFGRKDRAKQAAYPSPPDAVYTHPVLGDFLMEADDDWLNESATVEGFGDNISVHFEGDESGPSKEALESYEWYIEDPNRLWRIVQDDLYELYDAYPPEDRGGVTCENAAGIRDTADVLSLSFRTKEDFEITMTFRWQHPKDDHIITAYVENGESQGNSVDG